MCRTGEGIGTTLIKFGIRGFVPAIRCSAGIESNRFETMPSSPSRHACSKTAGPSSSTIGHCRRSAVLKPITRTGSANWPSSRSVMTFQFGIFGIGLPPCAHPIRPKSSKKINVLITTGRHNRGGQTNYKNAIKQSPVVSFRSRPSLRPLGETPPMASDSKTRLWPTCGGSNKPDVLLQSVAPVFRGAEGVNPDVAVLKGRAIAPDQVQARFVAGWFNQSLGRKEAARSGLFQIHPRCVNRVRE
jgi:hypothetical protein